MYRLAYPLTCPWTSRSLGEILEKGFRSPSFPTGGHRIRLVREYQLTRAFHDPGVHILQSTYEKLSSRPDHLDARQLVEAQFPSTTTTIVGETVDGDAGVLA